MVPLGVALVTYRKRPLKTKGEAGYIPLGLTGGPRRSSPGHTRRALCRECDKQVTRGGCAPLLAHVPPIGFPRVSPDFLAYPVPKGCQRPGLATLVPRCFGVARSTPRMQPYPRAPGYVWPGHLHDTRCLSPRAMDTGFPTVAWRMCLCSGFAVTLPILAGVLGCACVGSGFACTLPILAAVLGCACACLCVRPTSTPPFLAGVCGALVLVRVVTSPSQARLRFWGVCSCVRPPPLPR